jgi:D-sorbitol dehydrogenase (acceptor)
MKRLEGKSALITGSARGIGRAYAEAYIREGATVAIADINLERATQTATELGASAYAVRMDVTDQSSIDAAMAAVVATTGKLDILINNAALFDLAPITDITRESYERLFSINVAGTLFTLQAAAKQMIAQGHGGKIINMASQAGRRGEALVGVYCATKAAVISLTQSAGLNLINTGSTSTRSHRAWLMASIGTASTRCLPDTRTDRWGRRKGSLAKKCPTVAWAPPRT